MFAASAGVAVYVVGNFHVRAGVAYFHTSVEDSTGSYDGKGSPGILAGAGYDLYLGRAFALTPYVTFLTGTLSHLDRTPLGSPTISTSGKVRAVNFGVSASFIRGTWWCTTTAGERVKVTRGNRQRALACLQQVEDRIKANQ